MATSLVNAIIQVQGGAVGGTASLISSRCSSVNRFSGLFSACEDPGPAPPGFCDACAADPCPGACEDFASNPKLSTKPPAPPPPPPPPRPRVREKGADALNGPGLPLSERSGSLPCVPA